MIKNFDKLRIHYWVAGIVIPIVISLLTGFVSIRVSNVKSTTKIEHIEKDVVDLNNTKVEKDVLNVFSNQLNRIERKLDQHIRDSK